MNELGRLFNLRPQDENGLAPHALQRMNDWEDRIVGKVPQLGQLSVEEIMADLENHLDVSEKSELKKYVADMTEWLCGCTDSGEGYCSRAYATWIVDRMLEVERLISRAYRAKAEKAEAEQRKKEYEDSWCNVYVSMNPPVDDAKEYLNDAEQKEFSLAVGRAIDAYLQEGGAYVADVRTMEYGWWLNKIQQRKSEEAQKLEAVDAASEYNDRLNRQIANLISQLGDEPRNLTSCFRAEIQDKRYTNHDCDYVLSKEGKTSLDRTLVSVANRRLGRLLSNDLPHFIPLPSRYTRRYFPLPTANYRFDKVPCIDISFDIFAAACGEIWLKPGKRDFKGYEFALPWTEDSGDWVPLEKPRFLAYYHLILAPQELGGHIFWRTIPLVLLKGLLNGEARPEGCTISAASDSVTTYRIQGFGEGVDVPDKFGEYLKSIGSIDKMVGMGIMTEKVGNIVRAELSELELRRKIPLAREKAGRRDSMKERAFRLFDEGRRPSDPEVKALGLKPDTAYRYFQGWKKA